MEEKSNYPKLLYKISPRESSHFKITDFSKQDNKVLLTKTAANIIIPSQINNNYLLLEETVKHYCLQAKTRLQKSSTGKMSQKIKAALFSGQAAG